MKNVNSNNGFKKDSAEKRNTGSSTGGIIIGYIKCLNSTNCIQT